MKKRIKKVILIFSMLILIVIVYGIFAHLTGLYIPCVFRTVTGLLCPGCGITHMGIELFKLNIKEAFLYNPGVLIALPAIIYLIIKLAIVYIKKGNIYLEKGDRVVTWILLLYLIVYGLLRNII